MKRFFEQSWLSFKGTNSIYSGEEFLLLQIGQPLLTLIFYVLLASYSINPTDLTRWVIGNSFLMCINTTIFSLGFSFNQERFYGRLRSIVVSPTNSLNVVLHKCFFPSLISIVVVLIGIFVGQILFNINISLSNLSFLILIIFISMLAASSFGIFISTFGLISDSMHLILNIIGSGLIIITGANFPTEQLPRFFQIISNFLPIKHGLNAAYELLGGNINQSIILLIPEVGIILLYSISTAIVFGIIEKLARTKGLLEIY